MGAVSWAFPYLQIPDSSEGPTKGAGGVAAGGLSQPGLAAYSDVTTASETAFPGTSAAAPHVAGAAALVSGRYPEWGPDQVEAFLFEHARDNVSPMGWDPAYGHGSLFIGDSLPIVAHVWLPLVLR